MDFINTLFLLIAVVGLGIASRHWNIFDKDGKKVLSTFVFNFALPALFVSKISKLQFNLIETEILLGSVLPIVIAVGICFVLYKTNLITLTQFTISILTLGFGSNAFFGIAYFDSMYGQKGLEFAIVTGAVLGMLGVLISVSVLEYTRHKKLNLKVFTRVFVSPPVIAIFIGLIMAAFELEITFFDKASNLVGKTAGGIAIFTVGMFIYDTFSIETIKQAMPYTILRSILLPLVTYMVLLFLPDLSIELNQYLFEQSGIPAAVSIAIFAQRFCYNEEKIAGVVVLSSISSFAVLGMLHFISGLLWF